MVMRHPFTIHFYSYPMDKLLQLVTPFLVAVLVKPADSILVMVAFVVLDMILGILAARKLSEPFSWLRLCDSFFKIVGYGAIIYAAAAAEYYYKSDFPWARSVTSVVAYLELRSIDEKGFILTGQSFFKLLINAINPNKRKKP